MELHGFSRLRAPSHAGELLAAFQYTGSLTSLFCATPREMDRLSTLSLDPEFRAQQERLRAYDNFAAGVFEDYTRNRAHPYLRKIETAGGWKAYEKAHRTKLLATFVPKFTHLVPKELVPLIVEFSFHVGFY